MQLRTTWHYIKVDKTHVSMLTIAHPFGRNGVLGCLLGCLLGLALLNKKCAMNLINCCSRCSREAESWVGADTTLIHHTHTLTHSSVTACFMFFFFSCKYLAALPTAGFVPVMSSFPGQQLVALLNVSRVTVLSIDRLGTCFARLHHPQTWRPFKVSYPPQSKARS